MFGLEVFLYMFLPMGDVPYPDVTAIDDPAMIQYIMALESNLRKSSRLKKIIFWMTFTTYILLFASISLNLYTIFRKKHYYKMIGAYIKNTRLPPRIIIADLFEMDKRYSPRNTCSISSTQLYNNHTSGAMQPPPTFDGTII